MPTLAPDREDRNGKFMTSVMLVTKATRWEALGVSASSCSKMINVGWGSGSRWGSGELTT